MGSNTSGVWARPGLAPAARRQLSYEGVLGGECIMGGAGREQYPGEDEITWLRVLPLLQVGRRGRLIYS